MRGTGVARRGCIFQGKHLTAQGSASMEWVSLGHVTASICRPYVFTVTPVLPVWAANPPFPTFDLVRE